MLIFSDESFFSKSWSNGLMSRTNLKQKENAQKWVSQFDAVSVVSGMCDVTAVSLVSKAKTIHMVSEVVADKRHFNICILPRALNQWISKNWNF